MLEDYLKKKIQPIFIEISSDQQFQPRQNLPIVEEERCKVEDNKPHIQHIVHQISAFQQPHQEKDKTVEHVLQQKDKTVEHVLQQKDKTVEHVQHDKTTEYVQQEKGKITEYVQQEKDKTVEHGQHEADKITHLESNEKDGILQVIVSESENEYAFTFECQMFEEEKKHQISDREINLNHRTTVARPQVCFNPESVSINPQTQICSLELRRTLLRTLMVSKLGKYTNIE